METRSGVSSFRHHSRFYLLNSSMTVDEVASPPPTKVSTLFIQLEFVKLLIRDYYSASGLEVNYITLFVEELTIQIASFPAKKE
ncbi:hypothetical protein P8452_07366 [Trifolium repens]|nr:hypothetical protein P8452_07366 [Trifolium repens]